MDHCGRRRCRRFRAVKIPVDGGAPTRLVTPGAFNPVWSPDDSIIAYLGESVGAYAPLLAPRACSFYLDGKARESDEGACSGFQSSRRLDSWTVEVLRTCNRT